MNMMLASFPVYPKPFASVRAEFHTQQSSFLKFAPHSYPLASKILVKNLPYTTGETTLQKEFSNFGKIAEVKVAKDVKTKRSKGYAFIQYMCQDDAMLALETMDQKDFYGRTIHVEIAKLGWDDYGARPRTSGPQKKWTLPEPEQEEVVDCWY
ncbi:hypothetical protein HN51_061717 [Arachis hypogaea]|uniref:glycine-rich RNA-binding protein 4, mitochondrial n=1 Tax=Arachis ipaensis TaxID=130454 RepID=UPI0007AF782F|nr:glycine-rich RNA-binding protein 4, mitochondrial [Arachis ipaensis]XP_025627013.1 glycine-rich RNA-binding protein 4, mitochondrial [Arachis hypogaea]XP_057749022.1 glycine-rich RNA-binding protein 4, mitochondrial [Arachis stenosperma]QHO19046.1 Multiple RNA-binding domain-containing protein [Arachis hypogaea]